MVARWTAVVEQAVVCLVVSSVDDAAIAALVEMPPEATEGPSPTPQNFQRRALAAVQCRRPRNLPRLRRPSKIACCSSSFASSGSNFARRKSAAATACSSSSESIAWNESYCSSEFITRTDIERREMRYLYSLQRSCSAPISSREGERARNPPLYNDKDKKVV